MICKNCVHLPESHSEVGCGVPVSSTFDHGVNRSRSCECVKFEPSPQLTVAAIRSFADKLFFRVLKGELQPYDIQVQIRDLIHACLKEACAEDYSRYREVRGRWNGDVESWDSDELDTGNPDWLCFCGWRLGDHATWPSQDRAWCGGNGGIQKARDGLSFIAKCDGKTGHSGKHWNWVRLRDGKIEREQFS